jgi:hypothetical protein
MNTLEENLDDSNDLIVARHLADRLNDQKSLAYYFLLAQTHSHKYLLDLLASILQIPDEKVEVSRAAIFVANVKRHAPGK